MRVEEYQEMSNNLFGGGGEIETLLRSHDWSRTPLGAVETWSESLKTAVQSQLAELNQSQRLEQVQQASVLPSQNCAQTATLRQVAQADAFWVTLSAALRLLTDANEIQATAAQILGKHLGASRVIYAEVLPGGEDVIVHKNYTNGVAELSGQYRLDELGRSLTDDHRAGQTAIVPDVANSLNYTDREKALYRALGIAAHLDVPLIKTDQFVALLAVHQATPREWTEREVKWVEETAAQTWAAVERARAEAALRESEKHYRLLFESIDEGVCTVEVLFDADGEPVDHFILQANPAFERQSGIVNPEGKRASALAPGLEQSWNDLYAQVIRTGEPIHTEVRSDALDRWFDVVVSRVGDAAMGQVAIVFTDISDRKQAEAIITTDLENTRLLRNLSARMIAEDNIQVLYDEIVFAAIILTRADAGSIQALDESTQELVLLATQGIDRTVAERFQRMRASSITSCGRVLATGKRAFVDFDAPESEDPDGSLRLHLKSGLVSAQSTPLISRSGRRIGMVSTHWRRHHRPTEQELRFLDLLARQAADLIEQRQTEAERRQVLEREQAAREEAERANRIKDEFLAVLSHELRSPLNPILGWTHLLRNGKLDPARQMSALDTIERNAKLQSQLIEDLLDISRIMQGKLSLTATSVSLAAIIAAAVETVSLAADAKNIQITLELDSDVAPVSGDAARLQQMVWNLLTNAVKFTGNGGQVTVQLRQVAAEGSLGNAVAQIRVIDTGKGIDPQFLPHVFEYFWQEDSSTTRKFGGLGLGLAIVRQIVELHGGTVNVESSGEDQGATFIVQLPALHQAAPILSEQNQLRSALETRLDNVQILLVEDDADTREFQAFLLEQQGATVTAVASGVEALQVLEQWLPDVMVSDIGMEEMDGYRLMQQLRSRPPTQGGAVPAIALTAYAAEIDQKKAFQAGFQTHLTKPLQPERFVSEIITLLKPSRV